MCELRRFCLQIVDVFAKIAFVTCVYSFTQLQSLRHTADILLHQLYRSELQYPKFAGARQQTLQDCQCTYWKPFDFSPQIKKFQTSTLHSCKHHWRWLSFFTARLYSLQYDPTGHLFISSSHQPFLLTSFSITFLTVIPRCCMTNWSWRLWQSSM